jgi:hypothetical protein
MTTPLFSSFRVTPVRNPLSSLSRPDILAPFQAVLDIHHRVWLLAIKADPWPQEKILMYPKLVTGNLKLNYYPPVVVKRGGFRLK